MGSKAGKGTMPDDAIPGGLPSAAARGDRPAVGHREPNPCARRRPMTSLDTILLVDVGVLLGRAALPRYSTPRRPGAPAQVRARTPRRRYPAGMPVDDIPDVTAHLMRHRSIRRYRPDPVPDDTLQRILGAGIRASSSGNMQAYSVIVTRDRTLRERLLEPHMGQEMVLEAPVLLTFCADLHRMRRWLALSGAADGFDDPFAFFVGAIDAVLVAQNAALAAEAEGYGICYLGSTLANAPEIGRILDLPRHVFPVTGFVLGVPAEEPPLRDRLPLAGLVHHETYRPIDDDGIRAIYHERETAGWARYMAIPELRARVEAAGVRNLAQIYSQVKYTREDHARYAANVLGYLREQGFWDDP